MIKIYPYKVGSASVKKLKQLLGGQIIKLKNSKYRYRPTHTVINWGNSRRPAWMTTDVPVLNKPENVAIASNKLATLNKLRESSVPVVPFTTDRCDAEQHLSTGGTVFVRHELGGHSGAGIEVIKPNDTNTQLDSIASRLFELGFEYLSGLVIDEAVHINLPDAELYTYGVQNNGEYRVHVFKDEVILYQKKSRRVDEDGIVISPDTDEADVRNLASGWVYRTGNLNRLERVEELAKNAVSALGLDFGAVDIIKDENGDVFVLEVNTAPGISNTETGDAYIRAFENEFSSNS